MLENIVKALETAGYTVYTDPVRAENAPCCIVTTAGVSEKPLPMGRLEQRSKFNVRFYPEPKSKAISFTVEEFEERWLALLAETGAKIKRLLRLVDTPDGLVRGRNICYEVKGGAVVVYVTYTEWLREKNTPTPSMGAMILNISPAAAKLMPGGGGSLERS